MKIDVIVELDIFFDILTFLHNVMVNESLPEWKLLH